MKNEDKLQVEIVMWFSQTYPEYYGSLWAVFNEDSKHKKSLGMHKGASDLQIFINGNFAGIELKAKNSTHKKTHINQQIEWGQHIVKNGGSYIMTADIERAKWFIQTLISWTDNVSCKIFTTDFDLSQLKKATIKF